MGTKPLASAASRKAIDAQTRNWLQAVRPVSGRDMGLIRASAKPAASTSPLAYQAGCGSSLPASRTKGAAISLARSEKSSARRSILLLTPTESRGYFRILGPQAPGYWSTAPESRMAGPTSESAPRGHSHHSRVQLLLKVSRTALTVSYQDVEGLAERRLQSICPFEGRRPPDNRERPNDRFVVISMKGCCSTRRSTTWDTSGPSTTFDRNPLRARRLAGPASPWASHDSSGVQSHVTREFSIGTSSSQVPLEGATPRGPRHGSGQRKPRREKPSRIADAVSS